MNEALALNRAGPPDGHKHRARLNCSPTRAYAVPQYAALRRLLVRDARIGVNGEMLRFRHLNDPRPPRPPHRECGPGGEARAHVSPRPQPCVHRLCAPVLITAAGRRTPSAYMHAHEHCHAACAATCPRLARYGYRHASQGAGTPIRDPRAGPRTRLALAPRAGHGQGTTARHDVRGDMLCPISSSALWLRQLRAARHSGRAWLLL